MTSRSRRAGVKRFARVVATSLLFVMIGAQFIRPEHPRGELPGNGRMNEFVMVPGAVDSLLRRSCYDCHSDDTRWHWYAAVAPVSWLIAQDVRGGRSNLDFSRWSTDAVREPTPQQRLHGMCSDVRKGIMPPKLYLLMHPRARLTEADRNLLCAWAES